MYSLFKFPARLILLLGCAVFHFYYFSTILAFRKETNPVELVVASLSVDNTTWLQNNFPQWPANVYVVDDPRAALSVPANKGRESAVYLTYIIDHYDQLPDTAIFIHSHRYQWHNEDPYYDGVPVLQNLKMDYVQKHGFATLRCSWELGRPNELEPDPDLSMESLEKDADADDRHKTQAAYAPVFSELFPELPLPKRIGVHCGAQFAVSCSTIRARPRADYLR